MTLDVGAAPLRAVKRLQVKPAVEGLIARGSIPVVSARVRFLGPPAVCGYEEDTTVTDERGHFRIARRLPGPATLRVARQVKVTFPSKGLRVDSSR